MPLPAEAEAIRTELQVAYTRVGQELIAELERIAEDPTQARYRTRLTAQAEAVAQALDEVDVQARTWASRRLPEVYQYGAMEAAQATGQRFTWTAIHTEAVAEIASDTYSDLLSATSYVRRDLKRFVRAAVRERANFAVAGGQTSTEAGRQLARILRERGVKSVRYSNGAKHTIEDYADTVLRSQVAKAHNFGVLNHGKASGVRYARASDGLDCGLGSHEGSPKVAGMVFPLETALSYPTAHPRCARAWSLEPLIRSDAEAAAARQYSPEEQEQLAQAERERARTRTVTGRLTARERQRRLRERERRLQGRARRVARSRPVPPRPKLPEGLTAKGAQDWMRGQWGVAKDGGERLIILDGLGDKSANAMARVMDDLMAKYPQTAERVRVFGASSKVTAEVNKRGGIQYKNMQGRAYADAAQKTGMIRLNQTKAKKYAETIADLEDDVRTGFHPPGTASIESVVAHEYGHHLKWQAEVGAGGKANLHAEIDDVIARHAGVSRTAAHDAKWARGRYDTMRGLSRYASQDYDELAGEALSEVTMSPLPRPFAVDIVQTLVRFAEAP